MPSGALPHRPSRAGSSGYNRRLGSQFPGRCHADQTPKRPTSRSWDRMLPRAAETQPSRARLCLAHSRTTGSWKLDRGTGQRTSSPSLPCMPPHFGQVPGSKRLPPRIEGRSAAHKRCLPAHPPRPDSCPLCRRPAAAPAPPLPVALPPPPPRLPPESCEPPPPLPAPAAPPPPRLPPESCEPPLPVPSLVEPPPPADTAPPAPPASVREPPVPWRPSALDPQPSAPAIQVRARAHTSTKLPLTPTNLISRMLLINDESYVQFFCWGINPRPDSTPPRLHETCYLRRPLVPYS
jgi:hypothetical protein